MSQASLSMRKIEEILRLKFEVGLPHRAIAKSCGVSSSTVSEYVTHAKAAGLKLAASRRDDGGAVGSPLVSRERVIQTEDPAAGLEVCAQGVEA